MAHLNGPAEMSTSQDVEDIYSLGTNEQYHIARHHNQFENEIDHKEQEQARDGENGDFQWEGDQCRRNRTSSETYVQAPYATLSPRAALENLIYRPSSENMCGNESSQTPESALSGSVCGVSHNCPPQSFAQNFVIGDFIQIFRTLHSDDLRVREPIITWLRDYIQASDDTARGRLVNARILPTILQAYSPAKDDVLDFLSSCVLPMLGPSFTQDDGGVTLFPLLQHEEPRLRASVIQALENAINSPHGSMENMVKAGIVGTLHPVTAFDDVVCHLWCRILPKSAPYLANRAEIDILFDSLNNDWGNVRDAASEAISVLAKTSESSRSFMLPTLLHNLENRSPASIRSISEAISLSGSTFISNGKEGELLHLILNAEDSVGIAAVEATIQLLTKGSLFEHEQLVRATPDILTVALRLRNRQSQRQLSLKLLQSIVVHLSYILFLGDRLARKMFSIFDDLDPVLSNALHQTWSSDPRVFNSEILPGLIPLLFEEERLRNPSVTALLRDLAPTMVPQLVKQRRLDILVAVLGINDTNVVRLYLARTCHVMEACNENEKGWFVAETLFVIATGKYLKGPDAAMRRDSFSIIQLLSKDSASRSGRMINDCIGTYLLWVGVKGEKEVQESSLETVCALFRVAADHAEQLVKEALSALCDILGKKDPALGVHIRALHLLSKIIQQSPRSPIIDSEIVAYIVKWLGPRHTVIDSEGKKDVLYICRLIAEHSDAGRLALIEARILPELVHLSNSQTGYEVIGACEILAALVQTSTFRQCIIAAGLKTSMEHITSPIRKSTLKVKEEKHLAQAMAKKVLKLLKLSQPRDTVSLSQPRVLQELPGQADPPSFASNQDAFANGEGIISLEKSTRRNWARRLIFDSLGFDTPGLDTETEELALPTVLRPLRADLLPPLHISDFPQDTPIVGEEDLEHNIISMEPNSPSIGRRTGHSSRTSAQALTETVTTRPQRHPDENHLRDMPLLHVPIVSASSSFRQKHMDLIVWLRETRSRSLSYRPSALF